MATITKQQAMGEMIDLLGAEQAYRVCIDLWQIGAGRKTHVRIEQETAAGIWPILEAALIERGIVTPEPDENEPLGGRISDD